MNKKYRVYIRDIACQTIIVEATDEQAARAAAEEAVAENDFDFEETLQLQQSEWQVNDVEPITD